MVKYGNGLKVTTDNYKEFGKFILNVKLLYSNVLYVKYPTNAPVKFIKKTTISDTLKEIIVNLFETSEINYQLCYKLSEVEKHLFDQLIVRAGLNMQLNYKREKMNEDIKDIINEFNILKGEIIAGNNNPTIIQQIKVVLNKLVSCQKITQEESNDILNEIE